MSGSAYFTGETCKYLMQVVVGGQWPMNEVILVVCVSEGLCHMRCGANDCVPSYVACAANCCGNSHCEVGDWNHVWYVHENTCV